MSRGSTSPPILCRHPRHSPGTSPGGTARALPSSRDPLPAPPYLSILTRAGMPPDLKMERRPSRWCERLCRMLVVQRAVSRSLVLCMVRTTAATIWGDCIRARRDASFLESWLTIMAALLTTTWGEREAGGWEGVPLPVAVGRGGIPLCWARAGPGLPHIVPGRAALERQSRHSQHR